MTIRYCTTRTPPSQRQNPASGKAPNAHQFQALLSSCSLGARRPTQDLARLRAMLAGSNLLVSAWERDQLVGIARAVTDFSYCCYLSDLAVADDFQRQGIGKTLIDHIKNALDPRCKIVLVAAPDANSYYEPLGFSANDRCWVYMPKNE